FWEAFSWRTEDSGFTILRGQPAVINDVLRSPEPPALVDPTGTSGFPPDFVDTPLPNTPQNDSLFTAVNTGVNAALQRVVISRDTLIPVKESALYSNVVSNRMYGPVLGCGHEVYLGHGFAVASELTSSLMVDVVKTRVKYLLQDPNLAAQTKKA